MKTELMNPQLVKSFDLKTLKWKVLLKDGSRLFKADLDHENARSVYVKLDRDDSIFGFSLKTGKPLRSNPFKNLSLVQEWMQGDRLD